MRFAYADPPYYGCGKLYVDHHEGALEWDKLERHEQLVEQLETFDGWGMSLSSPSLRHILPMCPAEARVMAWVKPFASFKPHVSPAYCWEPVIICRPRKLDRSLPTVRDYVSAPITLEKGLVGAKPEAFCRWLIAVLGVQDDDELVDLFPGTGILGRVREQRSLALR